MSSSWLKPQLLPPEGEDGGQRREAEKLELTGEGSGGAGTGENLTFFTGEKVTFFTGGQSLTEGPGMEAGIRRGQPKTGGTPGTIGTEEKTGFNLSTDTESDFSLI